MHPNDIPWVDRRDLERRLTVVLSEMQRYFVGGHAGTRSHAKTRLKAVTIAKAKGRLIGRAACISGPSSRAHAAHR
jgi:hypothetical protein